MRCWVAGVGCLVAVTARAACETSPGVLLNEALPYPADGEPEWVELLNAGPLTAELEGWAVESSTSSGSRWSSSFVVPSGVSLAPGQRLVLGGPSVAFPGVWVVNVEQGAAFGNNSTAEDAIRLVDCAGAAVDVLVYGSEVQGAPFVDEAGDSVLAEKLAPKSSKGRSLARLPDGSDTNNGATDFVLAGPTPGRSNDSVPTGAGCAAVAGRGVVRINELLPAPGVKTAPGGTDGGYEWVELYNPGDGPVDVGGWQVQQAGAPADWGARVRFVIPEAISVPARGWLVLADPQVVVDPGVNILRLDDGSLGLGNSQDGVRLVDCAGGVVDQVVYGGANPDAFATLDGDPLDDADVAPAVKDDLALARRADGYAEGTDAQDFVVSEPTPGRANLDLTCKSGLSDGAAIRVNELFANPAGSDSEAANEWIELYNAGGRTFDISTWSIVKSGGLNDDLALPLTTL
ncbi:MAG TPA: lamin tail domain-containing protein, partial [Myxococcota bacterium]|nr:lamin tail domain-containing protein [Myxococcota bacterium]